MDKITHEVRLANWADIIKRCQERPEGQSAKQWIADNGINEKTYYYWQRRVRMELFEKAVSLPAVASNQNDITFAEVPAKSLNEACRYPASYTVPDAVIKTNSVQIEINNSIAPSLLKKILEVVTNAG